MVPVLLFQPMHPVVILKYVVHRLQPTLHKIEWKFEHDCDCFCDEARNYNAHVAKVIRHIRFKIFVQNEIHEPTRVVAIYCCANPLSKSSHALLSPNFPHHRPSACLYFARFTFYIYCVYKVKSSFNGPVGHTSSYTHSKSLIFPTASFATKC